MKIRPVPCERRLKLCSHYTATSSPGRFSLALELREKRPGDEADYNGYLLRDDEIVRPYRASVHTLERLRRRDFCNEGKLRRANL